MEQKFISYAEKLIEEIISKQKKSEPGGLPFLFWGNKVSDHSFYIKVGRTFEKWFKYIAKHSEGFELLPDGITKNVVGNKKSKDIDFIIKNETTKHIYYLELKSNLLLDTEKLPATYKKVSVIKKYLKSMYSGYTINCGILHWAVYDETDLSKLYRNNIKKCKESGVKVYYPNELFKILNQDINENDYYGMFRNIAKTKLINF